MVLGVLPGWRAHERADGEVEARRAVLPLVIAGRGEVDNRVLLARVPEDVLDDPVDLGVAAPSALVRDRAARSWAQPSTRPCLTRSTPRLVLVQPGDRPDRPGHEDEAVGESARQRRDTGVCTHHASHVAPYPGIAGDRK